MAPGPKPVSLARLQAYAWVAAKLLFTLREGRPGRLCKVNLLSPSKLEGYAEVIPANMPPSKAQELQKKMEEMKKGDWVVELPVTPAPELWERLKHACSEREIKLVAKNIGRWEVRHGLGHTGNPDYDYPRAMCCHARTISEAMRLPEYPKSHRPRSDDKRIWFFAKVLAGVILGRAPLYTLKQLSRWRGGKFPKLKGAE